MREAMWVAVVYQLDSRHRQALEWFEQNAEREFAQRPFDVGLAIKVTSKQKGIWKPAGTPYAVSVVQTHKGVYDDLDPIDNGDGTWSYFYHQQGQRPEDLKDPQSIFANAALFACKRDGVPVGVVIPARSGHGYEVLGLAMVEDHNDGYFRLLGPVSIGAPPQAGVAELAAPFTPTLVGTALVEFDPHAEQDSRVKIVRAIHKRQGAPRFRRALLTAYGGRCAMTQYDAEQALEAAHIIPYKGPQTNHPTNGLLLRADMHDLFDLGLVAVDTDSMRLRLAPALAGTLYEPYEGTALLLPSDDVVRPNIEALDMHRERSAVA